SAEIVGADLPDPIHYEREPERVVPAKHWRGLVMLTDRLGPRYPEPGSVDLAHVALMHMSTPSWEKRLRHYMSLVRPGGYFLFAHSHLHSYLDQLPHFVKVRDEFEKAGWSLVAEFSAANRPLDYPVTQWWVRFGRYVLRADNDFDRMMNNFLLVFRKGK